MIIYHSYISICFEFILAVAVSAFPPYNIIGCMSRKSVIQRKNNHQSKVLEQQRSKKTPVIHIFGKNKQSLLLSPLQQQLNANNYQYELHQETQELRGILAPPYRKILAVICLNDTHDEPYIPIPEDFNTSSNNDMAKICTLGGRNMGNEVVRNFQTVTEMVEFINAFVGLMPAKIKLAGVHSISVTKDRKVDTSRSLKKVNTDATYPKVLYFMNSNSDYGMKEGSAYESLVQALEGDARFEPFKSSRQLQKKEALKDKQKYLVLASTNESSIKIIKQLRKAKLKHFDYILLGRLDPHEQYLDESVLLASNDLLAHISFLQQNGFQSYKLRNLTDRFANPHQQPIQKHIMNMLQPYQTSNSKIVAVQSPKEKFEDQYAEKKKIRKIKSPTKNKPSQIQPHSQQHVASSPNSINVIISKHKDEPIIETQQFRMNKQGEKIYKKQSTKSLQKQQTSPTYQSSSNYFDARVENMISPPSRYDAVAPIIENQFSAKKANSIQSKYRIPNPTTSIIQQTSDEYRGSNKESIMNLEPERPKETQPTQNQPYQEYTTKRVVHKGITYANQPETHYINSNRTIQYIRSNQTIPNNHEFMNNNITNNSNYNESANNTPKYISAATPRVISGTPITITNASNYTYSNGTRVYGRPSDGGSFQSPTRTIRKEVTAPEEIIDDDPKPKEENRMTFGTNSSMGNNTLNYSISNASIGSAYRNPQTLTSTSNYYNGHTFNYHTINSQPYNSKIQISSGRVQQVVSPSHKEPTEQPKGYLSPPKVEDKTTKQFITSTIFNSDDYEQIQRDGRIIYRKKVAAQGNKCTPINYVSPKNEKDQDGSPTVRRYQVSPLRREANAYQNIYENRKDPQTTYGATYQYGRIGNIGNVSPRNYEVITVPYKTEEHNLGEMIESSHKKKTAQNNQNINRTDNSKNFVGISYRNDDRGGTVSNYKSSSNGVRVYGVSHPRVEVQKMEKIQPRVESTIPKEPVMPPKSKPQPPPKPKQQVKPKIQIHQKAQLTPNKNALNESNWFSRMSELHSDGSILRRNNIRFGVKLQKKEQRIEGNSVVQNKLVSGIYKVNDLNKKMALNRIIQGEQYIDEQRQKYSHINPSLNRFHLLLQEDIEYLHPTLIKYLAHPQDRIDLFAGVNSLFATLNNHSDTFDIGFIFAKQEEIAHINSSLLPQNYYLVSIEGEDGLLEISQAQRRVRVDQLRHFPLVQRIILDSQLYQYVAYRNSRPEVELLADKFVNSEFILEKIETQFTTEILDCYYYELPRLTRLYVLCDEEELPGLLKVVQAYSEVNPGFKPQTCKLVCVLSNILGNDELIMAHPTVTFISNPEEITHFRNILHYAHHYDAPDPAFLPIDHLFYHSKHAGLQKELATNYPGRFAGCPFSKVGEVYPKVDKISKIAAKYKYQPKIYLVLHQNVNAQKIRVEYFTKIFMLGKAKVVQNKVVRVMNTEQLLQLLKK